MKDTLDHRPARQVKSAYPLTSLALLVTMLACLLACTDLDRWREQYEWLKEEWPWRIVALFGGAGLFGGLIGVVYLFAASTSWRSGLLAVAAGVLAGEIGVLILVAPGPIWRTIFAVGVLVATAVIFRLDAE